MEKPRLGRAVLLLTMSCLVAHGQFKERGPAPFPPAVAHQRIKALLEKIDAGNANQTVTTLLGWVGWYRDILDEELIARWKGDERANLALAIGPLADAPVAAAIVEFSWRVNRGAAFNKANEPVLEDLMARYPKSAKPFLDDLTGAQRSGLSPAEVEVVCRILLDMPDLGSWKKIALQVLPNYRSTAEALLAQDLRGADTEKSYRAEVWRLDLHWSTPAAAAPARRRGQPKPVTPQPENRHDSKDELPPGRPHLGFDRPGGDGDAPGSDGPASVQTTTRKPPTLYTGAMSGTLESKGSPIPSDGEYVFRNLPHARILLDYDTSVWEATFEPSEGLPAKLVVRNKSANQQKRCVMRWTVIP
jgi:hypothetical protein